ncbi:hypothetical protein AB1N83_005913 [Pleurotus pulmonarius]
MGSPIPMPDGLHLVCAVGVSCRLPGKVMHPDALWDFEYQKSSSCGITSYKPDHNIANSQGQWLGAAGLEADDTFLVGVRDTEAETLHPTIRLGLDLTREALESSGIPPSSLRGKNVAVIVDTSTTEGRGMQRSQSSPSSAASHSWATSRDTSGIAGHISQLFDFCGISNTMSNVCDGGALAIHEGVLALQRGNADVAIVGVIATNAPPSTLIWGGSTAVASADSRSFAHGTDESPSAVDSAVFFVLRALSAATTSGDAVLGIIRGIALGRHGSARSLFTSNVTAQIEVANKAMLDANVSPDDIVLVEVHDAGINASETVEAESIRTIYGGRSGAPLFLSFSENALGYRHEAAAFVSLLKVLLCFRHRKVLPRHANPSSEFLQGPIIIPTTPVPLTANKLLAQVNVAGSTGCVSTIIVEGPLREDTPLPRALHSNDCRAFLPFSTKSASTLQGHIENVCSWAIECSCSIYELAAILSICREHYAHRRGFVISSRDDLVTIRSGQLPPLIDPDDDLTDPDEVPLEFLNLGEVSPRDQCHIDRLLESGKRLEVARSLYETGHNLNFGAVYAKTSVDPSLFLSFPSYPSERRPRLPARSDPRARLELPLTIAPPLQANGESFDQPSFERWIAHFGSPCDAIQRNKPPQQESSTHFLITGANGMLGCLLLERLLQNTAHHVYCIIRGEPMNRLRQAFEQHSQDTHILESAVSRGSLTLLSTSDLTNPRLGLSTADYNVLSDNVDEVVHAAWNVNFNLPLVEFYPILCYTRLLAEFCVNAKKRVRYNFIDSYAGTFNYPEEMVPERALEPKLSYCLSQGYAISKMVAEHSLLKIFGSHREDFSLAVIRVGQICGDTRTGDWSQNEMMPMMIASLPSIGVLPATMPPVSWIPSDVCATVLCQSLLSPPPANGEAQFIHLANPAIAPWSDVAHTIARIAGIPKFRLVPLAEYISIIKRRRTTPISRLLPYLTSSLEKGTTPTRYASLQTDDTSKNSPSLASCPHMNSRFLTLMVEGILKKAHRVDDADPSRMDCIFLFGPWMPSEAPVEVPRRSLTEQRIMVNALRKQSELGASVLSPNSFLEQQLRVLAAQISAVESVGNSGYKPLAVLGYCFGEYAAAVSAGIISEDDAVNILVHRAHAIQVAGVSGSMMNVFCSLAEVRRLIATLHAPPSVAIHAGPSHVVLSGSRSEIDAAKELLLRHGIKCLAISGSLPFHSSLMDDPVRMFVAPDYVPQDSDIAYISGITCGLLPGHALKPKYWLRHLREPVDFNQAVLFGHREFPGAVFIDMGPGSVLTHMIKRYDARISICGPTPTVPLGSCRAIPTKREAKSPKNTHDSKELSDTALSLLQELFGYQPSVAMLECSLHSLGLQSMDFIRFAEEFEGKTGVKIPLSAYVSNAALFSIVQDDV